MNVRVLLILLIAVQSVCAQSTLYTVENNGPRSQRINVVFLSEAYSATDLPNFAGHVTTAVNYLFSREPWMQYRSYCNVFRIEIASNQSGADNGTAGGLKDTYFNSGFNNTSVPQLLTVEGVGSSRAYTLLNQHVPEYDLAIILVNDTKYGGSGGPLSVASIHSLSAQLVEHEIGHSFAGLADEYDQDYPGYFPSEKPNNTAQTVRALIKWNVWIDAATPVATPETAAYDSLVGLFEGSMYRTTGWYRPHNNSLMRNLNRPVGNVNREQFLLSIYNQIDPVDGWTPSGSSISVNAFQQLSFGVTAKQSTTGSVQTQWYVDEQPIAGATGGTFVIASDALGNGAHSVRALTSDATPFVRNDPTQLLKQNVSWSVTLTNQLPATLAAWRTAFGSDTANPSRDGYLNLAKYALGTDPTHPIGMAQRPFVTLTPGAGTDLYLTLNVPRRTRRSDITNEVQISSDLATWNSGAGYTVTIEDRDDLLVVRDAIPVGVGPNRSMRLRVQAP
jgi:hypothetical protein